MKRYTTGLLATSEPVLVNDLHQVTQDAIRSAAVWSDAAGTGGDIILCAAISIPAS